MAKLQEHNNLLSSKVDETQQLLNQQHMQNIQTTQSSQSLQTPSRKKKGKKVAKAMLTPSKQLVVPAPRNQPHSPKKVYSDCRRRLNDKEVERQRSPIRINARLRDSRIRVLGSMSPIRKVRGLESEVESDDEYVPSKTTKSTYCLATPTLRQGLQVHGELLKTMVLRRFQAKTPLFIYSSRGFRR
ncbi:hypothetical protein GBA52_021999 [Prunus armeniaca]|nr:hypothetical protein GBA52_028637 [Prunus armeniaca]KAH0998135.1 hypothetical protein GBA52_021999 [Prunus armeniaca]